VSGPGQYSRVSRGGLIHRRDRPFQESGKNVRFEPRVADAPSRARSKCTPPGKRRSMVAYASSPENAGADADADATDIAPAPVGVVWSPTVDLFSVEEGTKRIWRRTDVFRCCFLNGALSPTRHSRHGEAQEERGRPQRASGAPVEASHLGYRMARLDEDYYLGLR
jgi:hypothetical protein